MSGILYIGNDNVIELRGLQNTKTGDIDESATCLLTLLDSKGDEVPGQVWPTAMQSEGNQTGNYSANVEPDVSLVDGRYYTAVVDVAGSGGETAAFACSMLALARACT